MARIVFMGTPEFAVPALQALIDHHEVVGVVTQPDRPAGRGGEVVASPVKRLAEAEAIPVFQPEKIRRPEAVERLRDWAEVDAYVVAAFGQILPQAVLDIPRYGSINIHASLLPRWRGAAPIHAAIRAGDPETGVTIMKMDAGLDTGPMLSKAVVPIAPDATGQTLHDALSEVGARLLIETLPAYFSGALLPQPQPDDGVTFAPQIEKAEGRIDWTGEAGHIERTVRAFTPWPGTFTVWDGQTLKILRGAVVNEADKPPGASPGTVVAYGEGAAVVTGRGLFIPLDVQLAGKKATPIEAFLRGHPGLIGAILGD
jgi:methionyl-tRNA formyltransferase